jgi:colanic acid biosynthesis protein WcaH
MAFDFDKSTGLGVFEHFYDTNAMGVQGFGTHYVVLARELLLENEIPNLPKVQHSDFRWMTADQALANPEVHPNSQAYLK